MKFNLLIIASIISTSISAQTFVNGSFEKGTANKSCGYNLSNTDIKEQLKGTNAFGAYEQVDILMEGCIIESIADGNYAVGIANKPSEPNTGEAISLELSKKLEENAEYEITFKVYAITKYGPQGNVLLGASSKNDDFGTEIHNSSTTAGKWVSHTFKFKAGNEIQFITIKPVAGVKSWNVVDDFSIKKL